MAEQASRLRAVGGGVIASGILFLASIAYGQGWPMGGQNLENSRSQSVTKISPRNIGTLKQKWVFTTRGNVSATPAVHDGTVYFPDWRGYFYAVDASNGALRWSRPVGHWTGVAGDWARDDPAIDGDTLILGDGAGAQRQVDHSRRSHRPWGEGDRGQSQDRRPHMVHAGRDFSRRVYDGFARDIQWRCLYWRILE